MVPKIRKLRVYVSSVIPYTAQEIFEYLSVRYNTIYVGVYLYNNEDTVIYINLKNAVEPRKISSFVNGMNINATEVVAYKVFEGSLQSHHGDLFTTGRPVGTRNLRSSKKSKYPRLKNQTVVPTPPTPPQPITPTPTPVSQDQPIISTKRSKNLCGIPEMDDYSRDFLAIWGSDKCGHWYPIGYVGPERSIVSGKRRSVTDEQQRLLMEDQKDSCNECGCDVFMGKLSNADVDHIIPLRLGGSCQISNLQILCVTCHRRKTALECKKIRCNVIVGPSISLQDNVTYVACSDIDDPDYEIVSKNPKDALSNRDGLYRLVY